MSNISKLQVPQNAIATEIIHRIPVHQIRPNPHQPRKRFKPEALIALRDSIREHGQHLPIKVRPVDDDHAKQEGVKFEITDGERRWRSASMDGSEISHLKAIIEDYDRKKQYELSCAMNFNREGHTGYEELMMVHELVTVYDNTQSYVATLLGKNLVWVNQRVLAHERLCQAVMIALKDERIPISIATTLARLNHNEQVVELKNYLNGGSTAQVKAAVDRAIGRGHAQGGVRKPDAHSIRRRLKHLSISLKDQLDRYDAVGVSELKRSLQFGGMDEGARIVADMVVCVDRLQTLLKGLQSK